MRLKEQKFFIFTLVCIFILGFIFIKVHDRNTILRLDKLERNQISLSSKIDEIEAESKVQQPEGIEVTVTAYNAIKNQTDNTPNRTASNKKPKEGFCGVSRDLEELLGLKFGDLIYLDGLDLDVFPVFQFQDRMHKRKKRQVDIYMKSVKEAKEFGIRKVKMYIIRRNK